MFSKFASFAPKTARALSTGARAMAQGSSLKMGAGVAFGVVAAGALSATAYNETTREAIDESLTILKKIESELGIAEKAETDYRSRFSADANYPKWTPQHKSLARKYLTREVYRELYNKRTSTGFTVDQAIQTAIDLPTAAGAKVAVYAGDEDTYEVFAPLFDPIIEEYHGGYTKDKVHTTDLDYTKLRVPNIDEKYIISTRIRAGRSIRGHALPAQACRADRTETEDLIVTALNSLSGELKGKYYPLMGMTKEDNERLINDHFLFENPDETTMQGGFGRDWPDSRGIFHNDNKTFLVWVNEEDHMRIISMQKGADVKAVFKRFADACNAVEQSLKSNDAGFMHNNHLGYITACPTNLGTGLRASVHVKLPNLGRHQNFKKYAESLKLQVRGKGGEKDHTFTGVFDVSNRHRLGYSEVELVQTLLDGLEKLVSLEKKLEAGETIDI